jgi:hypothetical protein
MLANEALRGADLIGAKEFGGILRELLALFPEGDRIAFLDELSAAGMATLRKLDDRFFELLGDAEQSRLAIYCASYVEAHPEEFFLPLPELEA